ncbi:hypothetical protein GW17_00019434 [Ensete ventricosum]|nr:hypothetical protein GW17_00019434 [Ensete ventricosum]RZS02359.1 hypothetical protein BHM03_00032405 [Ensete ventricosum]
MGSSTQRSPALLAMLTSDNVICNVFTLNILSWTEANRSIVTKGTFGRRKLLLISSIGFTTGAFQNALDNGVAVATEFADSKFSKFVNALKVDWDGYTIGYYGRIFEARNKTKGGSFEVNFFWHISLFYKVFSAFADTDYRTEGHLGDTEVYLKRKEGDKPVGDDKDFFKFKVGSRQVIPAFEEAIVGMTEGGIRSTLVKKWHTDHWLTLQGQRALDFVLRNQGLIDKTLLFDIELLKIVRN